MQTRAASWAVRAIALVAFVSTVSIAAEPPERLKAIWDAREKWLAEQQRSLQAAVDGKSLKSKDPLAETKAEIARIEDRIERYSNAIKNLKKTPARSRAIAARHEQQTAEMKREMVRLRKELAELKDKLPTKAEEEASIKAKLDKATGEQKRLEDAIPAEIDRRRKDLAQWPILLAKSSKVGDVGYLPSFPWRTPGLSADASKNLFIQQLEQLERGEGNALVRNGLKKNFDRIGSYEAIRRKQNVRIVQILGDDAALATLATITDGGREIAKWSPPFDVEAFDWPVFWLKGVSLKDVADGSTISVDGVMLISGTQKYETANNSQKTVLVIEPFDAEQLRPFLGE